MVNILLGIVMDSTESKKRELRQVMKEWLSGRLKERTERYSWSQYNQLAKEIGEKVLAESVRLDETEHQFCHGRRL
jgi:hypothetical protein